MSCLTSTASTGRPWLALAFLLFCAHAAQAAPQTFVSAKGDDANSCEQDKPCRTFAGAIAKTDVGGEVAVLDSGEYGPFHVPFSLKVTASGVYAGVTAFDTHAVTVKVNSGSVVALRGLTLTGWSSSRGILYEGPGDAREGSPTATLHVEDCTISGFAVAGISFVGNGSLFVKDTTVRNTLGTGIQVNTAAGETARATVVNTRLEKNDTGLWAYGQGTVEVTARDAVASGNKQAGFVAAGSVLGSVRVQLRNCVSTQQKTGSGVSAIEYARVTLDGCLLTGSHTGVFTSSEGHIRLSDTTVTDNEIGVRNIVLFGQNNYGHVYTFGNNRVFGNKKETEGKASLVVQQF